MKYFDWTEEKNYTLALLVLKYKGYKTTDIKQLEKWEVILDKIKTKPGFEDLAIKPIPLQTHFKRMQEETLRAWPKKYQKRRSIKLMKRRRKLRRTKR